MRRGRTDGTWLVAWARQRPIDLWPDRPADTFATWLQAHPGGIGLSRDRSATYAWGALRGAPEAQPVLERWLDRWQHRLAAMRTARQIPAALMPSRPARSRRRSTPAQGARQVRRARRLARDPEVQALPAQDVSPRHMAPPLQLRRPTVSRSRRPPVFPERAQSWRERLLAPSAAYLQTRWEAGGHHGVELWREIQALGFSGTCRLVSNGGGLRRALERRRPSTRGRRPALPQEPAMPRRPASAAGGDSRGPAPRQLVGCL